MGMVILINNGGKTLETAIVIKDCTNAEGVGAEYDFLEKEYGARGVGWQLENQALIESKGRHYDELDISLKDGTKIALFFDIEEFFDKW